MFKTKFSGTNKMRGVQKPFRGHCPQMPLSTGLLTTGKKCKEKEPHRMERDIWRSSETGVPSITMQRCWP